MDHPDRPHNGRLSPYWFRLVRLDVGSAQHGVEGPDSIRHVAAAPLAGCDRRAGDPRGGPTSRGTRLPRPVGDREHAGPCDVPRSSGGADLCGGGDHPHPARRVGGGAGDPQSAAGGAPMGDARPCQQRPRDPRRGPGAGTPLSGVRSARGRSRAPFPRGGRTDPRAVDAAEGGLPRPLLPPGRRHDVAQAGAVAAADLDGRRPSQRGAPRGVDRRRLDGVRRFEHRRVRPLGAAAARGAGEGGARSGSVPDLEAPLHGRG